MAILISEAVRQKLFWEVRQIPFQEHLEGLFWARSTEAIIPDMRDKIEHGVRIWLK